ncbi:L-threonylcarbamoyladenylate synthase [Rivibacter subsaxonicus]|uniref:Threonylcarbamoyl-AMP synthase n=1 Tax=Rivibacter subsaxonicus TaxID=457575 RepID=A0A4Q7VV84_9BURK|nr:L-threonylcarbamoyladenylate synthase [Rivibacter subsaxonicus]RZU00574.1 translation factor SUA5 [Rivibacter subsaxonicus]
MPILPGNLEASIARAAQALADGELVAFPTETVYGLGARADDDGAVRKIFAAKGRPADHPLIVHVPDVAGAEAFAAELPPVARRLIEAFWPGPLTVIVPRRPELGAAAAGGQATIGLRSPAHPVARALLEAAARLGVPGLAAPSANRFGRVSPTSAQHVASEFDAGLRILDGGDCALGIESAIVDCSRGGAVLLRPGVLEASRIEAAAGVPLRAADAGAPRASGTLEQHYAPTATVRLMPLRQLRAALDVLPGEVLPVEGAQRLAVYSLNLRDVPRGLRFRRMPADAAAAAHELFAALREFDAAGVSVLWVEEPPDEPAWAGVRDRLRRAAA